MSSLGVILRDRGRARTLRRLPARLLELRDKTGPIDMPAVRMHVRPIVRSGLMRRAGELYERTEAGDRWLEEHTE